MKHLILVWTGNVMDVMRWLSTKKIEIIDEKVYKKRQGASFLVDVKKMISSGKDVYLCDPYLDLVILLDLFRNSEHRKINIVVGAYNKKISYSEFEKFKIEKDNDQIHCKVSSDVHDRVLIVDDRCWVIGSSLNAGATDKPTYIRRFIDDSSMREIYKEIWKNGTNIKTWDERKTTASSSTNPSLIMTMENQKSDTNPDASTWLETRKDHDDS